jgi:hyperosmotically inducible protein
MFRLLKLLVLLVVLVAAAGFFLGWWTGRDVLPERGAVATAGRTTAERAKEVGTRASEVAKEALSDGSLTTKIKAKMALDDMVRARDISVSTTDGVVTVSGTVHSKAERERALQLAKETNGVRQVLDKTTLEAGR